MAQPTWLLMQRVTLGFRTSRGMWTASMRSPSRRRSTTLVAPSSLGWRSTISGRDVSNEAAIHSRACRLRKSPSGR